MPSYKAPLALLGALCKDLDIDVAVGGLGVRAEAMREGGQLGGGLVVNVLDDDVELDGEADAGVGEACRRWPQFSQLTSRRGDIGGGHGGVW